jgi:hypothetical protein
LSSSSKPEENLRVSWKPISFANDLLKLQLLFEKPYKVSPDFVQDTLIVNLTDAVDQELLVSVNSKSYLDEDSLLLGWRVRKQMKDDFFSRIYLTATYNWGTFMQIALIVTFTLSMKLTKSMEYVLLYFGTATLILHLCMLKILVPANVSALIQYTMPII